jgi:hypothetical protein
MKLKKFFLRINILLLIFISPIAIFAQNISTSEASPSALQNKKIKRINIQELREEVIEKNKAIREEFKEKLKALKDEKKQTIVERIDNKITNLNKLHTDRFNNILERLGNILDRIQEKVNTLEAQEKDVSSLNSLIDISITKISEAQTAVNEQAAKDYIINIQSEQNLGQTISAVHLEFKNDIKSVRDLVKDARRSVLDLILELKDFIKS